MNAFLQAATPVLLSLAPFIVPILAAWLTLIVKAGFEKMPAAQKAMLSSVVSTAVKAVEQSSASDASPAEKKSKAMAFVQVQLDHYGIKVPLSVVDPLIEEAVLLVNMAQDAPSVSTPIVAVRQVTGGNAG